MGAYFLCGVHRAIRKKKHHWTANYGSHRRPFQRAKESKQDFLQRSIGRTTCQAPRWFQSRRISVGRDTASAATCSLGVNMFLHSLSISHSLAKHGSVYSSSASEDQKLPSAGDARRGGFSPR